MENLGHQKETPQKNIKEGIKTWFIKESLPNLVALARKLKERASLYDFIISDEASARLVSLFVKKVLDAEKQKHGLSKVSIKFVATGRHNDPEIYSAIGEYLRKTIKGKSLVVTEVIDTGNSMRKLIAVLDSVGLDFDVAALSASKQGIFLIETRLRDGGHHFVYGSVGSSGGKFHSEPTYSGVEKSDEASPFPISAKNTKKYKEEVQETINQAREDINLVAERTIDLLDKEQQTE